MASSKVDICNIAMTAMSLTKETITNIDIPNTDKEKSFALIYDDIRRIALAKTIPSFALKRANVARLADNPAFGYEKAFQYPADCLKFLGIGNLKDKMNQSSIESVNGIKAICTNYSDDVLPIRYIEDVKDESRFDAYFSKYLGYMLASELVFGFTGNAGLKDRIDNQIKLIEVSMGGINAQENPPIRINRSKRRMAGTVDYPSLNDKM